MGENIVVGSTPAYLTASDSGLHPGLILIHEVWGLNDHIKEVAERYAKEGYAVLAPDLLSHTGMLEQVTPELMARAADPATRDEAQKELRLAMAPMQAPGFAADTVDRLQQCFTYLSGHEATTGIVAVLGFCFGGTYSFELAAAQPDLACAVPFYGHGEQVLDRVQDIQAPILAFYGEQDARLVDALPRIETAMQEHGKSFESHVYPGTGHAFFNNTNPTTYNTEAASDAWRRSLAFLQQHTSTAPSM